MATPAFLRYLPARLKPLSAPAVWAPLTIFTLISAFMWEYHHNPEWFNRPQANVANPNSTLTPEEQAQLSEIDALDVLLKQTNLPSSALGTGAVPGAVPGKTPGTSEANQLNGSPDGAAPNAIQDPTKRNSPFAAYEEQYRIPGSASAMRGGSAPALSASGTQPSSNLPSSNGFNGSFSGGGGGSSASAPIGSALSEALTRQQQGSQSTAPARQTTTGGNASASSQPTTGLASDLPDLPTSGSGISAPYIRTTPDMSPPVGTTGYRPPASSNLPVFNVAPQQPSQNPYSVSPFQQNFSQPQSALPQPTAPQPAAAPTGGTYTPPSFTQPEQNRTVRQPTF